MEENETVIKLKALSEFIEQVRSKAKPVTSLREYIYIERKKYYKSRSLYAECVRRIYEDYKSDDIKFLQTCMFYLNMYLSYATGETYNSTVYSNDYRKKHYKQLNVDIPIKTMEAFEKKLKEQKKAKKEIVLKWVMDYIEKE